MTPELSAKLAELDALYQTTVASREAWDKDYSNANACVTANNNRTDCEHAVFAAYPELRDALRQAVEELWDREAVHCGNCNASILCRGSSVEGNNGLSKDNSGEEELLCGRCAGMDLRQCESENNSIAKERDKLLAQMAQMREELEWQLEAMDQGFLPTEDDGWQCTECDMEAVNIGEIEHSEDCCSGRMRKALAIQNNQQSVPGT